jgi:hypothetical protein
MASHFRTATRPGSALLSSSLPALDPIVSDKLSKSPSVLLFSSIEFAMSKDRCCFGDEPGVTESEKDLITCGQYAPRHLLMFVAQKSNTRFARNIA